MTAQTSVPHTAQDIATWFLAWISSEEVDYGIAHMDLNYLVLSAQRSHTAIFGSTLYTPGTTIAPADPESAICLDQDFDFDTFTHMENQFLIQVWDAHNMKVVVVDTEPEEVEAQS